MCFHDVGALNLQIKDCMTRYNGDADQQRRKKFSFPARLICADCYEVKVIINGSTVYTKLIKPTVMVCSVRADRHSAIACSKC